MSLLRAWESCYKPKEVPAPDQDFSSSKKLICNMRFPFSYVRRFHVQTLLTRTENCWFLSDAWKTLTFPLLSEIMKFRILVCEKHVSLAALISHVNVQNSFVYCMFTHIVRSYEKSCQFCSLLCDLNYDVLRTILSNNQRMVAGVKVNYENNSVIFDISWKQKSIESSLWNWSECLPISRNCTVHWLPPSIPTTVYDVFSWRFSYRLLVCSVNEFDDCECYLSW